MAVLDRVGGIGVRASPLPLGGESRWLHECLISAVADYMIRSCTVQAAAGIHTTAGLFLRKAGHLLPGILLGVAIAASA
jgi:hypothetical protein